jgi:5-formyltetrahydrofolate cyclo-ligase
MEKHREPDTWLVVDRLRREFPHVRIVLPKVEPGDQLVHLEFEGLHQLKKNKWGISEPQQGTKIDPKQIDLVIVPLLAANRHGHRLGYGKGFYDRFLSDTRPDCLKIGYSLLDLYVGELPQDVWDAKLTHVITATEVLSTRVG